MISKKQYNDALETIEKYKKEQIFLENNLKELSQKYPIGTKVFSKTNIQTNGIVYEYSSTQDYYGNITLKIKIDNNGKKSSLAETNCMLLSEVQELVK